MVSTVGNKWLSLWFRGVLLVVAIVVAQSALQAMHGSFGLAVSSDGVAIAATQQKSTEKTRKTPALRNEVYEQLAKAQELSEEGNINEALKVLKIGRAHV